MTSAAERRNRHNVFTLTGALLASFAIVLVTVLLAVRPDPTSRPHVDWHDVRLSAPSPSVLVDPTFTATDGDWWANRAEFTITPDSTWYIGLISPSGGFVSVEQFLGSVSPDVAEIRDDVDATTANLAGVTWSVFDRSGVEDPGNRTLIYEIDLPSGGTLIVSGTANPDEIELVAIRAFESLKG